MTPELPSSVGFSYCGGQLCCDGVALTRVAAEFGTPAYVYSRKALESAFGAYQQALAGIPHLLCYAVKANSNRGILNLLARLGAGFDIVGGGELERVLAAGGDPSRVVYSGVGKSEADMEKALRAGIACFNLESVPELDRLEAVAARLGLTARISVRVNPDVDAKTHPYISTGLKKNKFGVAREQVVALYKAAKACPHIEPVGIDAHIGSQITQVSPYLDAAERIFDLVDEIAEAGIALGHIDFGGGLGIRYDQETPPHASELIGALRARMVARGLGAMKMIFEPGRSIVGNSAVLLARVEYLKKGELKNFAIVDAGMNDLARPAMYEAYHGIVPVVPREGEAIECDIVGPICESGDWLGRDRSLCVAQGDLLAITSAGAYGSSMASNYNSRGRAPEIVCDQGQMHLVRRRETAADLIALESTLP